MTECEGTVLREQFRILKIHRVHSPAGYDFAVQNKAGATVNAPADRREPIDAHRKGFQSLALGPGARKVRKIPSHANPPGFAGPAGRFGKRRGAAAAVAGFSNVESAMVFERRAVLSFFAHISFTAVS
jgi:hypothetical protein